MKVSLIEPLRVDESIIKELAQPINELGHEFVYYDTIAKNEEDLFDRVKNSDIIMIANTPFPNEVLERLDKTQLINVAFTGVDHVDGKILSEKEIKICNASGYATQAVAELTIGLTLDVLRKISQGNQDVRLAEEFLGPFQGSEIFGKTVGIVGTGEIGVQTAKLYQAFGANVIAYNRSEKAELLNLGIQYKSLDEVMKLSDIISIHLPLTDQTKHIIDKSKLSLMKETAILINVARGGVIDNHALAKALNNKEIKGAGIDVFDQEPPLSTTDPLLTAKNTVLTPHVGYLTNEAMKLRAEIAFDNTIAFLKGSPQNIIN